MEISIMTSESIEKEGHLTLFPVNIITRKCRCVCAYCRIRKGIDSSLSTGKFLCNKFCMSIYSTNIYQTPITCQAFVFDTGFILFF